MQWSWILLLARPHPAWAGRPSSDPFGLPWGTRCKQGQAIAARCDEGTHLPGGLTVHRCTRFIGAVRMDLALLCEDSLLTTALATAQVYEEKAEQVLAELEHLWGPPDASTWDERVWQWGVSGVASWSYRVNLLSVVVGEDVPDLQP